jgi:dynactin complex subunit
MMAHLTTVESHLEAQTKINDKLQAENVGLKAKQEEENNIFNSRTADFDTDRDELKTEIASLKVDNDKIKDDNYQLLFRVDDLETKRTPPLPNPPPL